MIGTPLDHAHLNNYLKMKYPITITLEGSDVEWLLSLLDEEPQVTRANRIREEILKQTYE